MGNEGHKNEVLRIVPLGGFGEIGKNMVVVECGRDMLVIDAGLMFPEEEMLGIDFVIPDTTYVVENAERVRGVALTHGHEDHVGALPYLLRHLRVPVFGTRLTLGLAMGRLREDGFREQDVDLRVVDPGKSVSIGCFAVTFIGVNHSVPDSVALGIRTPAGTVVHTGDFKFDQTPVDGGVASFHKFAELGDAGVLVLLSDSTNAERPGFTLSERTVGQAIADVFRHARGRIIVATFASNVHRIQQVFDAAHANGRRVAVVGRSILDVVDVAVDLGYLRLPEDTLVDVEALPGLAPERTVILSTGTQGEPMSALTRMAMSDHKKIELTKGDTVVIAATPVPGNEKLVARTVDHLFRRGAEVIYETDAGVHVSGHASQEELKLMLNLVRPKFFVPIHGEYRHLVRHARLATEVGIPEENIFVVENGSVMEFTRGKGRVAGRVTAGHVLVDGLGVGDVGNIVLRDRRQLAQDGIMIVVVTMSKQDGSLVAGPDLISRGFVYVREAESLIDEAREEVRRALVRCSEDKVREWSGIKATVRESLGSFLYEKTRRRPMILPVIMEV